MISFDNTYNNLPPEFYEKAVAKKFSNPELIIFNNNLAKNLFGATAMTLSEEEITHIFSGQKVLDDGAYIAQAYAGHQFGHFSPRLGDGRALLLGEVIDQDAKRFDIQLKGSGPTAFSRRGDGLSALGPVIREYILCEAMFNLGVPTTRALAAINTNEDVYRETQTPGGIFSRVASSHIRIGTFEYFAGMGQIDNIKLLADYAIKRHYPELKKEAYLDFLFAYANRQSSLIAQWMGLGFIHGVMNTDNMSICGETIDYGPCAFMDEFSFTKKFSSIDTHGRYCYINQIEIAKWNLYKLASCLIPLIDSDFDQARAQIEDKLKDIDQLYEKKYILIMLKKLGISNIESIEKDKEMINLYLSYLEKNNLDFTNSFRNLDIKDESLPNDFKVLWAQRINADSQLIMDSVNPVFIPRNHQVEKAIQAANIGDYKYFHQLNEVLANPFTNNSLYQEYTYPPKEHEKITKTFCGT